MLVQPQESGVEFRPHSATDSTRLSTAAPRTALRSPLSGPKLNSAPGAPAEPVAPAGPAGPGAPAFGFFFLLFLASASPRPATTAAPSAATPPSRRVMLRRVEICSRSCEMPLNACAFITLFLVS